MEKPRYKAVVFYMGDISYSTYGERLEMEKRLVNFIHQWLDFNYGAGNVEHRFFVHDAEAHEVAPDGLLQGRNAGGTRASIVFELVSQIAFNEYDTTSTNFYGFYFGDGEVFEDDAKKIVEILARGHEAHLQPGGRRGGQAQPVQLPESRDQAAVREGRRRAHGHADASAPRRSRSSRTSSGSGVRSIHTDPVLSRLEERVLAPRERVRPAAFPRSVSSSSSGWSSLPCSRRDVYPDEPDQHLGRQADGAQEARHRERARVAPCTTRSCRPGTPLTPT